MSFVGSGSFGPDVPCLRRGVDRLRPLKDPSCSVLVAFLSTVQYLTLASNMDAWILGRWRFRVAKMPNLDCSGVSWGDFQGAESIALTGLSTAMIKGQKLQGLHRSSPSRRTPKRSAVPGER